MTFQCIQVIISKSKVNSSKSTRGQVKLSSTLHEFILKTYAESLQLSTCTLFLKMCLKYKRNKTTAVQCIYTLVTCIYKCINEVRYVYVFIPDVCFLCISS